MPGQALSTSARRAPLRRSLARAATRARLAARWQDVARLARLIGAFAVGGLGIAGATAMPPGRLLRAAVFSWRSEPKARLASDTFAAHMSAPK